MEQLLSQAAAELSIRSEVESTLTTLLQDLEHAHTLEKSLHAYSELHQCQEQLAALRVRYEDREAAWEMDRREKERLGMMLLEQVVKLSAREVEGEKSKREMELRLQHYLEDEKRSVGSNFGVQQPKQDTRTEVSVGKQEGGLQHDPVQTVDNEKVDAKRSELESKVAPDELGEKQVQSDTTNSTNAKVSEGNDASETVVHEPTKPDNQSFVPHDLDETTLMKIFEHCDPLDVMNFAQTNKALLKKVNVMFGMDSGEEIVADQEQINGTENAAASVETSEPSPSQPAAVSTSAAEQALPPLPDPAVEATTSTSSATPAPAKSSPKLFGMSGPSHRRQGSGTSVATAGSAGTANPFSQVSSWFGSSSDTSSTTPAPTTSNNTAPSNPTTTSADTGEIKLNAAMASSMASKLTPAELSIILRMREKLIKCEADANKWRAEKEDALANLASVEAVKEFLVARVRDTERVVQKQKEDMRAAEKKNLEDQEVIVFLDEKVTALEKVVKEMKSEEAGIKQASLDIVNKNEKKARVLSDMLRFEREQMASNEKDWKAAKKVLVKEVKSCRSRIVALEAEVGGCHQQNSQLKQGLMSLTQSSGSMSPGGKKNLRKMGRL